VLSVDPAQRLGGRDAGGVAGGLARAEIAAIAEHGEDIALFCPRELGISAGGRSKVARVAGPASAVLEDVEQMSLRHARVDLCLEGGQALGQLSARLLLQMGNAIGIDGQFGVGRKVGIHLGSGRRQLLFQLSDELVPSLRHSESATISRQTRLAHCPRQELGPVVAEILSANNVGISGLQRVGQMNENADLERAAAEYDAARLSLGDKALPTLRCETDVEFLNQIIGACMAVLDNDRQRVQQTAILGRRADVHQAEQPEQQSAGVGMDRPKQRQFVVAVPSRYRLASLRQRVDAALFGQEAPDPMSGLGVGFSLFGRLEHSAEDGDQSFFHPPVLILECLELLLGDRLGPTNSSKQHLDQLVAAARSSVLKQAEKQGMALACSGHIQKLAHFQGCGFGGKLSELGVGDAFQYRIRVNEAGQPVEPSRPQPDRLGTRRAGRLLEAAEGRGHVARLDDQQSLQGRDVVLLQSGHDLIIHSRVDLGSQMVRQPIERAEGWQVGRGFSQRLDRSVDQVRRVAHRRGSLEHGSRVQLFARFRVGRGVEIGAHRNSVMVERCPSPALIQKRRYGGQRELRCQMPHRVAMNVDRRREAPEILARLQQGRQRQPTSIAAGRGADESVVGFAQAITGVQFLTRQSPARMRVSGAVHRCHGVSGKGFAEATVGNE